jgi:hypothetical protein
MNPHATIYYDLDLGGARENRSFVLRFSCCVSFQPGLAVFRSQEWKCQLPNPNVYIEEPFGTSETRGIVGGVQQSILAAQSAAIERALGDALVLSFTQVLDEVPDVDVILVRGPAFPKTLGRFLSMRPSSRVTVGWVMSLKESQAHPIPLLFPLTWYEERSMAWDSEALINSFTHPETDPIWAIEFLNIGDSEVAVGAIRNVLDNYKTNDNGEPRDLWCARKLLRPGSASDYVFSKDKNEPCPSWITEALSGGPVGPPEELEFDARNLKLLIFPWQNAAVSK